MEHLRITVDGKTYDVIVESSGSPAAAAQTSPQSVRAAAAATPAPRPAPAPVAIVGSGEVPSPLAGIVKIVHVAEGAAINEGDLIITLEAMKMYTPITAPRGGTVSSIKVKEGDAVDEGQALFTLA